VSVLNAQWSFVNPQKLKTATTNSKILGKSHFSQNNNRERISVLLKTETLSCDIFVKMGRPEILLVLQILHKNIIEGTLLSLLQKSAPLDFCEKIDATIRILALFLFH
jgi:hydroxypyruvate isomerase